MSYSLGNLFGNFNDITGSNETFGYKSWRFQEDSSCVYLSGKFEKDISSVLMISTALLFKNLSLSHVSLPIMLTKLSP